MASIPSREQSASLLHWLEATSQRVTAVDELAWHLCWGLYRNRRRLALANEVEGQQAAAIAMTAATRAADAKPAP